MTLTQKQRITPIAMVTLCIIVVVMTMLFAVYYANAINNQNNLSNRIASLQTQNSDLQNQIASRDAQIASLSNQLSTLNTQMNALTADKQNLQGQINQLYDTVDALSQRIAQLNAALGSGSGGVGGRAVIQ
jgi:peptidoglycan hydrolase CwlO-like protein